MRTFTITSLMSSFPFTPQLALHLLCPLSSVTNVALPSLCTTGKAEFGAVWHNSFKPTTELLPPLCDCHGYKSPAEPALGDLQMYKPAKSIEAFWQTFSPSTLPSNSMSSPWSSLCCFHPSWLQLLCFSRGPPCCWGPIDFFLTKRKSTVGWTLLQSYRSQTPSTAVSWQKPLQGFPSTPNMGSGSYWHKGPVWCYTTLYLQGSALSGRRIGKEMRAVSSSPEYLGFWVWPGDFVHLLWL